MKTLPKNGECFQYFVQKSHKTEAKILNGVYTGPEIRKLLNDDNFSNSITQLEQSAWKCFSNVLGNNVANAWSDMVDEYINSMQKMGCTRMSNKMHLLYKHKDKYKKITWEIF